jgi:hypothetical protein
MAIALIEAEDFSKKMQRYFSSIQIKTLEYISISAIPCRRQQKVI